MDNKQNQNINDEPLSTLNKKRAREESEEESEEDINQSNKKKKIEIKNYLAFPKKSQNNLYNIFSPKIDSFLINKKNISTTSSKNKYNYICQEINTGTNSLQINDAKILTLENKILIFLLSFNNFYIYEIKENKNYELIKEINLNQQNSFTFSYSPTNFFLITPEPKKPRKNQVVKNINNRKIRTKMVLYICIISCNEKYLCQFDLKELIFKKVKNILSKRGIAQYLINNDMKYKLYNNNKILCYNNHCAYIQKFFGSHKFKNLKLQNIESVSILNKNLFCICTPDTVYVYETKNETILGEFKTHNQDKKAILIKPDNNLLLVYSNSDIALYDLESLMFFQKLELNYINDNDEQIKKVKQLNNNNIAILFTSIFAVYNLEKNAITFKCDYWKINNMGINSVLMEINPNVVLLNNDEKNFYLINSIKGDKIASLNINDNIFSLCKKIKKYKFKYGVTVDKNIEIDEEKNTNYILIKNYQNTFILSSVLEE